MRKAAIRLSTVTGGNLLDYLKMPMQDFVELNNEVVEEWRATKH